MSGEVSSFIEEFLYRERKSMTIDEMADKVMASVHIPGEYRTAALRRCVKSDIRRSIKRLTMPDGLPVWHSIPEPDGKVKRYKQLELFDRDDFVRVWNAYDRQEKHAARMKDGLEKYFSQKFVGETLKQYMLPFPDGEQIVEVLMPSLEGPED